MEKILQRIRVSLIALWLVAGASSPVSAAEPVAVAEAKPTNAPPSDAEQQLRASLKLQEQLHTTLLAIEQARLEASAESHTNAELLGARIELLEKSLAQERERQAQITNDSSRTMLLLAGSIVGVGLLALAFTALFQSRGMNRLSEIATGFANERNMLGGNLQPSLGHGERLLIASESASGVSSTLLATIGRMERRLMELENAVPPMSSTAEIYSTSGETRVISSRDNGSERRPADRVTVLVGKGQVLMNLSQPENALACFDEAILAAPNHAETHMKKGMALERLKRFDDAIACYNRAIALNKSLTQAYLSKGGIYNQQERYSEALECYEQALRSEAKA